MPIRSALTMLAFLVAGCGGPAADSPPPASAPPETPAAPASMGLSAAMLGEAAEDDSLVPSPMETQKALESAGITTDLATLVPVHNFNLATSQQDHAAVRTGVLLADLMLTVKTADKAVLLDRLAAVRTGMSQLGGGKDIDGVLGTTREQIRDDTVTRDKLVADFDDLAGAVIPELEFNGQKRVLPLIQAGTWLEAANLVAKAVQAQGSPSAADALLKQPSVVDYFIGYVQTKSGDAVPETVTETLLGSLRSLRDLSAKDTPLTNEDIDTVITVTDNVLKLL